MENPSHNTSGKYMKGAREEIENVKESEQEGGGRGERRRARDKPASRILRQLKQKAVDMRKSLEFVELISELIREVEE
jgi:hypothetical protein